jgi:hypothetical protein
VPQKQKKEEARRAEKIEGERKLQETQERMRRLVGLEAIREKVISGTRNPLIIRATTARINRMKVYGRISPLKTHSTGSSCILRTRRPTQSRALGKRFYYHQVRLGINADHDRSPACEPLSQDRCNYYSETQCRFDSSYLGRAAVSF